MLLDEYRDGFRFHDWLQIDIFMTGNDRMAKHTNGLHWRLVQNWIFFAFLGG